MDFRSLFDNNLQLHKLSLLLALGLLLLPALGEAQQACNIKPDPVKRKDWLLQTKTEMLEFSLQDSVERLSPVYDHYDTYIRISYQLRKKGLIYFGDKDWIYIVSSNSHDQPEVGDLAVAMDQDHNFYLNRGHVCGGTARYICNDLKDMTTASLFFSHFIEDIDLKTWTKWDN